MKINITKFSIIIVHSENPSETYYLKPGNQTHIAERIMTVLNTHYFSNIYKKVIYKIEQPLYQDGIFRKTVLIDCVYSFILDIKCKKKNIFYDLKAKILRLKS